jgi:hypothetical protein
MSWVAQGLLVVSAALVGPLLAIAHAVPSEGAPLLVLSAPWADVHPLVSASGGRSIGPTSAVFGTLAISDEASFAADLKSAGAWTVLDGRRMAVLC